MIVGTAGHIDHGKSTLVRALTGVDTDRLPEEKKRGISIELGYAFLDVPDSSERIGFVDVPGHERLVHTMLAGASGIDFALLLVAADDGVMPQTREHLAVLALLGKQRGAVVLTKVDRVDDARLDEVEQQVWQLLQGSTLAQAPMLRLSALTGQGVEALRGLLWQEARARTASCTQLEPGRSPERAFRLAVDRSFTLSGTGTVVTGTIHHGSVRVGDALTLVPSMRAVRVRSLHAQNQPVQQAHAGQRCAMALAGIDKESVHRGDWMVDSAVALSTDRLDATLTLWKDEDKPLRSGARVQVHLGAASLPGTVALLDVDQLLPGATAKVQILTRTPLGAWHGDRVVLRDASATRTLAGGSVLDPMAPVRYRRTPERLAVLQALQGEDNSCNIQEILRLSPNGINCTEYARKHGMLSLPALPQEVVQGHAAAAVWGLDAGQARQALTRVLRALADFHAQQPDELGPAASRLRRLAVPRMAAALWEVLLRQWQQQGALVLRESFVHLPEHGVRLSATEERVAQKTLPQVQLAGFDGAWARDLAKLAAEPEALVRATLARMARRGELHQVVKDLYVASDTMQSLVQLARTVAAQHEGRVLAADYRDATGLGRKRAIQILEYFDRIGLLRRVGDIHYVRTDSQLFMPG